MGKRSYVPPIEIRVGQNRDYQKGVDRMTCKHPGCRRWRVDGKTKFCADHGGDLESLVGAVPVMRFKKYKIKVAKHIGTTTEGNPA